MREYIHADLDLKYKILAFISFNNTNIISFLLNVYIKILSNLGIKKDAYFWKLS